MGGPGSGRYPADSGSHPGATHTPDKVAPVVHTTVHTAAGPPGERDIWHAAEAARAAGATHYAIMAPHPDGGQYRAA